MKRLGKFERFGALFGLLMLASSACSSVGLSAATDNTIPSYATYTSPTGAFQSCYPSNWTAVTRAEGVSFQGATTGTVATELFFSHVSPPFNGRGDGTARELHVYELTAAGGPKAESVELPETMVSGKTALRLRLIRNHGAPGSTYQTQVADIGTTHYALRVELRSAVATADELIPVFNAVLACTTFSPGE